ncbi:MAG: alpha-L-fucosidase [Planctomycetota bacterium]|jgi:alpha-L-fucosidase
MMSLLKRIFLSCILLVFVTSCATIEKDFSKADPDALERWQDMRFGMFIHWGPVSLTGHEIGWSRGKQTPIKEYDQLYTRFNPTKFDAEEWAQIAKDAGMKYMVLTTKHHDGFCLWDTKQTDYNIMNSPFGRDVVKELSAACKKYGIAFGAYYSTCDWYHPSYPKGNPRGGTDKPNPNMDRYIEYLQNQVKELTTSYGPLLTIWFDVPIGVYPQHNKATIGMLRTLQPDILINNRIYLGEVGRRGPAGLQEDVGDYSTPEQRVGGFNRTRPWETCMTICRQWAWKPNDRMKSLKECIQTLISTAGGDGNLLFNVGPMPDGQIESRQVERLKEMGQWMDKYGDYVYGTRGGPFKPGEWGASTCKDDKIYLFVMRWPNQGPFKIPALPVKIKGFGLKTEGTLRTALEEGMITIDVSESDRDPIATVIELTVQGKAFEISPVDVPLVGSGSVGYHKEAKASNIYQSNNKYAPSKAFDDEPETRWATDMGIKTAWLEIDLGHNTEIGSVMIDEGHWNRVRKFQLQYFKAGKWRTIIEDSTIGDKKDISFKPVRARRFRLNIVESTGGPTILEMQLFEPN